MRFELLPQLRFLMAEPSLGEIHYELEHIQDDRGPNIIWSYSICLCLAFLAVALRFIARRASKSSLQADDFWIFVSLVSSVIDKAHHGSAENFD